MIGPFRIARVGSGEFLEGKVGGKGIGFLAAFDDVAEKTTYGIEADFYWFRDNTGGANVKIYSGSTPTTRTDGTPLIDGDEWIDIYNYNKLYIRNSGAWVDASDVSIVPVYTNGSSFPSTPKISDWHFYSGSEGSYHANTWYKYNGSDWENKGLVGTYMDNTGVYTGTVTADKILAGSGIINSLSVLSTLTLGSSSTNGTIQSYGWNGTANGFQIKGGASPSVSLIGATIKIINPSTFNNGSPLNTTDLNNNSSWDNTTTTLTSGVSLSAGGIVLGTSSSLRSGQTSYNNGTGWWLGAVSGTPKFSIGNGSTHALTWDGTTLAVSGSITLTNTLSADKITDGSTNKVYTGTEQTKLTGIAAGADQTAAALTSGVSLSAGGITLGTSANIKSGMTSYSDATNAGFFHGLVSSVPKFRMQTASSASYFDFTGSALNLYNIALSTSTITGSEITVGTGNDVAVLSSVNSIYRIYVGSSTPSAAPFRVSKGGVVTATGANISGTVTITNAATFNNGYALNTTDLNNNSSWDNTLTSLTSGVSLSAGGITLGTSANIKSGMTSYSDATNAGFFLGLVSSVPKFRMQTASSASYFDFTSSALNLYNIAINASTITGGVVQTATSGDRVVLSGANKSLIIYNNNGVEVFRLYGNAAGIARAHITAGELFLSGDFVADSLSAGSGSVYGGTLSISSKFEINSSGQLTKINNVVTSGYIPISDGTHYEPRALTISDIPLSNWGSKGSAYSGTMYPRTLTINGTSVNVLCTN